MRRALQTAERAFAPLARRLATEALHWSARAAGEQEHASHEHTHTQTHRRESTCAADCEIGERGGERGRVREGEGEGEEERVVMRSGNSTDDGQGGVGVVRVVVQALHRERDGGMGRRCDSGRHNKI